VSSVEPRTAWLTPEIVPDAELVTSALNALTATLPTPALEIVPVLAVIVRLFTLIAVSSAEIVPAFETLPLAAKMASPSAASA